MLHGGRERSSDATAVNQLAFVRMLDMYAGLRRQSRNAAVYLLQFRVRGWNADHLNGADADPVVDAREALDDISDRHPGVRVTLLGHSMGGRTAFAVAADSRVAGVCALAPWLPSDEPLPAVRGDQRFVIAHGTADRMTSAPGSLAYAERLRRAGAMVARFELEGGRHDLLTKGRLWHRFAVRVPLGIAGDGELPKAVVAGFDDLGPGGLRRPLSSVSPR